MKVIRYYSHNNGCMSIVDNCGYVVDVFLTLTSMLKEERLGHLFNCINI